MTVTLIGMPGVGKTCMGKILARKLKLKFIDGDKVIESRTGRKLSDIISEDGLARFREIESEALLSINQENAVISTGGSAVYYHDAMMHFKSLGPVIYLYASPRTLLERLGDFSKRGIVLEDGMTISDLYNERAPLYEKYADATIDCDGFAYSKYQAELVNTALRLDKKEEVQK